MDRAYVRRLVLARHRGQLLATMLFALLLTASGVVVWGTRPAPFVAALPLGFGIGWLINTARLPFHVANRTPPGMYQERTLLLTEEFVQWQTASMMSRVSWDQVAKVRRLRHAYALWLHGGLQVCDVPRAGLTPEQEREFAAFLASRPNLSPSTEPLPAQRRIPPSESGKRGEPGAPGAPGSASQPVRSPVP
nr:YcxB family protein [Micromonospora sp. DSM 115978]